MKFDVAAILVGLLKLIPGILFLVYASEVQHLDEEVTSHPHDCAGNTDELHEALVGRSGLVMLASAAGICLLVDTVTFAIRFGLLSSPTLRGKLEQLNHLFEFFTCALASSVLHTLAQSENGLAVENLYKQAGCSGSYNDHLENGLALVAASYVLICFEFFVVRVQGLTVIPFGVGKKLQEFFESVTGDKGGCDATPADAEARYTDGSSQPILGYSDDPDKLI